MRASNFEQSVEIGGEGYFDVTNKIGERPPKNNYRFAAYASYLQHTSQKCCIIFYYRFFSQLRGCTRSITFVSSTSPITHHLTHQDIVKKYFDDLEEEVIIEPLILCHFACGIGDPKYALVDSWPELYKLLQEVREVL